MCCAAACGIAVVLLCRFCLTTTPHSSNPESLSVKRVRVVFGQPMHSCTNSKQVIRIKQDLVIVIGTRPTCVTAVPELAVHCSAGSAVRLLLCSSTVSNCKIAKEEPTFVLPPPLPVTQITATFFVYCYCCILLLCSAVLVHLV